MTSKADQQGELSNSYFGCWGSRFRQQWGRGRSESEQQTRAVCACVSMPAPCLLSDPQTFSASSFDCQIFPDAPGVFFSRVWLITVGICPVKHQI